MSDLHGNGGQNSSQSLQVWYCEHCRRVHFRTQNVMLDFTKKEFVELTDVMLEILQNNFNPLELNLLASANGFSDDVLASEIVS